MLFAPAIHTCDTVYSALWAQVRNIVDFKDESFTDPMGNVMPPCVVMERGESLDIWSERARPDRVQAFAVRCRACLPLHCVAAAVPLVATLAAPACCTTLCFPGCTAARVMLQLPLRHASCWPPFSLLCTRMLLPRSL
jgi:hypothetical protein